MRATVSLAVLLGACSDSPGGGDGVDARPPPAASCQAAGGSASVSPPQLVNELADSWQEAWLASPAVADLDGDGTPEIVVARAGRVVVWHADGQVVWSQDVEGRSWASPVVADLVPARPGLEVAEASAGSFYAWDATGQPLAGFPAAWRDELRSLAAGDLDGDGSLELAAVTTNGLDSGGRYDVLHAVHADGRAVDGFPPNTSGASGCDDTCAVYNGYDQNLAIGDLDGDDRAELFVTQDNAYLSLHDGTGRAFDAAALFVTATKFPGIRMLHAYAEAQMGWAPDEATALQAHFTNSAPAIVDLDGDGVRELVTLASVQNAAQTDREQGVALWVLHADGTRPAAWLTPLHFPDYLGGLWDFDGTNVVAITNQVSVAELDPARAGPEMVFAGFDGRIHVVDARGEILWSATYTTDARVSTGGVLVADLSADGVPELVFATYSPDEGKSDLVILDGGGTELHRAPLPGRGAMPVPTIADVDGDDVPEIVVSLKDGDAGAPLVLLYRVDSAKDNCLLWPTGRGNARRDGFVP